MADGIAKFGFFRNSFDCAVCCVNGDYGVSCEEERFIVEFVFLSNIRGCFLFGHYEPIPGDLRTGHCSAVELGLFDL